MRATDLAEDYPAIDVGADAADAARMIGQERRPAVLVFDRGAPFAVLPASQVVKFLVPEWAREDPSLVGVLDERAADASADRLTGKTVRELLGDEHRELPVVDPDATILECAAVMARQHSPLVVVMEGGDHPERGERRGRLLGAITAARILGHLVP